MFFCYYQVNITTQDKAEKHFTVAEKTFKVEVQEWLNPQA